METRPLAVLLKFPGTNADVETARALEAVGFETCTVPFGVFAAEDLADARLCVFSGGFSYGDYVMAGRLAQLELEHRVGKLLEAFRDDGGYLLGICNGFQILTQLGLLPEGSLIDNTSGRFQCRWVELENRAPKNAFLNLLPTEIELPIAHAEGRFVATGEAAQSYLDRGLVTLTYADDVNGSALRIAGMQDESGRVFGLMPHPERFLIRRQHYNPDWPAPEVDCDWGWGFYFFRSIFETIRSAAQPVGSAG